MLVSFTPSGKNLKQRKLSPTESGFSGKKLSQTTQTPLLEPPTGTKVINLSDTHFTDSEIENLKLGLSFIPTPQANILELERDLYEFKRKLRLTYHFKDNHGPISSLTSTKSSWTPDLKENLELDEIILNLHDIKISTKPTKDNINVIRPTLDKLLNRLKANEFVIKRADKGYRCTDVICNKQHTL